MQSGQSLPASALKKEEAPTISWSKVVPFGVFQIIKDGAVVDNGIGVVHKSDKLITLRKYFIQGRTLGRILFKKEQQGQQFPFSYDFSQQNDSNFIINKGQLKLNELVGDKFVNITLDTEIGPIPIFIHKKGNYQMGSNKFGCAIGFNKSKGDNSLHKIQFKLDSHIMDRGLIFQTAILFVLIQKQEYCYGFYDKTQDYEFQLNNKLLGVRDAQNEIFIQGHQEKQVKDPFGKIPYQSIGILRAPNGDYGTAQLLKDSKGCKYLITCAHNFIGQGYNLIERRGDYTFELPIYDQNNTLKYRMQKLDTFKIKSVYIPQKYSKHFSQNASQQQTGKFIILEKKVSVQQKNSTKSYYDIAIIELEKHLTQTHGFTIEWNFTWAQDKDTSLKYPVQIAGFPSETSEKKVFNIVSGTMYKESTTSHKNNSSYARLPPPGENGDIQMWHKLSTLPGSSGSAIYERISDTECRLLAIHTSGYTEPYKKDTNNGLGKTNYGTYIHGKNIKDWLMNIPGLRDNQEQKLKDNRQAVQKIEEILKNQYQAFKQYRGDLQQKIEIRINLSQPCLINQPGILALKIDSSSLKDIKKYIENLLTGQVSNSLIENIGQQVERQLSELIEDNVEFGVRQNKDDFRYAPSRQELLKFSWKVSAGLIQGENKEDCNPEMFTIFGLYYILTRINYKDKTMPKSSQRKLTNLLKKAMKCYSENSKQEKEKLQVILSQIELKSVAPYGIVEILKDNEIIDYGICVPFKQNGLITLQCYFDKGRIAGKIFFKKNSANTEFPILYDLSQNFQENYFIYKRTNDYKSSYMYELGNYVEIKIKKYCFQNIPTFLYQKQLSQINDGQIGFTVSLKKKGDQVLLHKTPFQAKLHILNLKLEDIQKAIIFTKAMDQAYYCYGFYVHSKDVKCGYDSYISQDILSKYYRTNILNQYENTGITNHFQYIGILKLPKNDFYGTAYLLKDKNGCKFVITCASIINSNDIHNGNYQFYLPEVKIEQPDRYKLKKVNSFKIQQVYIPKQYHENIMKQDTKTVIFKALNGGQDLTKQVRTASFYDIAIIKLQDRLVQTDGFIISDKKNIHNNIEIAGFPQQPITNTINSELIIRGKVDKTPIKLHQNEPDYLLSQDSDGDMLVLQKFFTNQCYIGSPIYEHISDKECYLFGIDTLRVPGPTEGKSYNFGIYLKSENMQRWLKSLDFSEK